MDQSDETAYRRRWKNGRAKAKRKQPSFRPELRGIAGLCAQAHAGSLGDVELVEVYIRVMGN